MSEKKQPYQPSSQGMFASLFSSGQQALGIDIGSSYLKIVQLQKASSGYLVKRCVTRAFPHAPKEDPGQRKKLIAGFIKEFLASGRLHKPLARLAIYGKGVFVFFLTVPKMSKKDLRSAVTIELKKRLPFQMDIANLSFDFFVNQEISDDKGVTLQVTCIAADRYTIDEQVAFLKDIGIQPVSINVIPDALGNALHVCARPDPEKTVALLDIGSGTSLLNFYRGRDLVFSREIPLAGEHFSLALAKTVNTSAGAVTISPDEAEKLKRSCGIPMDQELQEEFVTDFGPLTGEQILTMLRPQLERLVLEVSRTLTYYAKTSKNPAVEELYLSGGSSRLRHLDRFLQANLEGVKKIAALPVLNQIRGWVDSRQVEQELVMEQALPHLSVALGLCFGSGARINLLPAKERAELKAALAMTLVRVALPALVLLSAFFYAGSLTTAQKYRQVISRVEDEIASLQGPVDEVKQYQSMKARLEQSKELLEQARGNQPLWWGVFKEISAVTPEDVILERLEVSQIGQQRQVIIHGRISSSHTLLDLALSQYIAALEDSVFFRDARLVTQRPDIFSAVPTAEFQIVCILEY